MKIITGGGGVDKDGKTYELPEEVREVPDSFFADLVRAMEKIPQPDVIPVGEHTLALLRKYCR